MSNRSSVHHVTVSLAHDYEFMAAFDDLPEADPLVLDEPPPLGEGREPNAVALLAAAVGNCLAASLLFCLRRSRAEVQDITAHVKTHVARTDAGRFRVSAIEVELSPTVGNEDAGRLGRCQDLFEDFCTVTASIRSGIPVDVKVRANEPAPATAAPSA